MSKKIILISIILLLISLMIISILGKKCIVKLKIGNLENISIKYDKQIINCSEKQKNEHLILEITSLNKGKTNIIITGDYRNEDGTMQNKEITKTIYVHSMGIITQDEYFGHCRGEKALRISYLCILLLIIIYTIKTYKQNIKNNMYDYKNIQLLGLTIFAIIVFLCDIYVFAIDTYYGFSMSMYSLINNLQQLISLFSAIILPIGLVVSILGTIGNVKLLTREGKNLRNMLAPLLGGFLCISTILLAIFGAGPRDSLTYKCIISVLSMFIEYIECILLSTIIISIKSAKHMPEFNKDYIIILGCKVKKDGTLTPILKGRVDRAIQFSKMQKEKTNKEIIFVPSGGKGIDEPISEAQGIKKYLLSQGIKEENILIEDKSTNTFENISFSNKIIKKQRENAQIAFSTTNYHVFRAGLIAHEQNLYLEGIGSKTKSYYYINAFIREFIATLVAERKSNLKILFVLMLAIFILETFLHYAGSL